MHNREGLTLKRLWQAATDYDLWPVYILYVQAHMPSFDYSSLSCRGLTFGIPVSPPSTYLTLSLKNLGFGTFNINLLTIPSTVAGIFTNFGISLISELVNERSLVAMAENVWALPFLIAIYSLPANPNPWAYYGLATALLSYPYTHPVG